MASGKNLFNSIQVKREKRNVFDLSHDVKMTLDMGKLYPTMFLDCVPGDKFNLGCETLLRFQPLISPVMHRMDVYQHYFFVPYRLLWEHWEQYITNTKIDDVLPVHPFVNITAANYSKLHDYLGIPSPEEFGNTEKVNAFPMAAYLCVYNELYRDQNLITALNYKLDDGDNTSRTEFNALRRRAWQHDYFTSALPFAQKGDPVSLPISGFSDVPVWVNSETSGSTTLEGTPDDIVVGKRESVDSLDPIQLGQLYAETSSMDAQSVTINDLRRANKLQEWLEMAARGGSRYVESIWAFFGVKSPDARLQRPEYITGSVSPVTISEVLNTTGTDDAPQGNMAGHGLATVQGRYGFYNVKEHGCIIGIMSVRPKTAYMQGIEKFWTKTNDPFEYYFPQFAHIGEQEVKQREVYAFQGLTTEDTFGYVPRYAEYKYANNRVAGAMRTSMMHWHFGRNFDVTPLLNQEFIECTPRMDPFAVTASDDDSLICHVLHRIRAVRAMPKFGTPSF